MKQILICNKTNRKICPNDEITRKEDGHSLETWERPSTYTKTVAGDDEIVYALEEVDDKGRPIQPYHRIFTVVEDVDEPGRLDYYNYRNYNNRPIKQMIDQPGSTDSYNLQILNLDGQESLNNSNKSFSR